MTGTRAPAAGTHDGAQSSTAVCALGIMAKAPRAGAVKTRLTPPLSPEEAAALQACFLRDTAENVAGVGAAHRGAGVAIYTPAGSEPLFAKLLPAGFRLLCQRGEGLGDRLGSAVDDLAARYAPVCLIDSDSPTLPPGALIQAVAALRRPGDRVVLGPAEDGGYYLIGLKAPHTRLFHGIDWSTERVLVQTLARAAALDIETELLPPWYDVDDAGGLRRLCAELFPRGGDAFAPGGYPAPHTRRCLEQTLEVEGRRWMW